METSFPKGRIRVLLLESVHASAHGIVRREGFRLEALPAALREDELVERIKDVHVLGIRSRTRVSERALGE
ncbi:MAG TPA: phosphoglycerate dehydrogenase, partial [Vicinamibacteria bacterium]